MDGNVDLIGGGERVGGVGVGVVVGRCMFKICSIITARLGTTTTTPTPGLDSARL